MDRDWDEVRERLERSFGKLPLYPAAVRVLDWLKEERPEHVDFHDLMRVAEVRLEDTFWIGSVLVYPAEVIEAEMLIDDGRGGRMVVPRERVGEAQRTGVLKHPVDDRPVRDWEAHVFPRFRTELPEDSRRLAP